jgi:hypothetical protein
LTKTTYEGVCTRHAAVFHANAHARGGCGCDHAADDAVNGFGGSSARLAAGLAAGLVDVLSVVPDAFIRLRYAVQLG